MPDISLDLRRVDYRSDQNTVVSAWRACADALFITPTGAMVSFSCVVDTGAPFSVLPFSLWHDRNLQWTSCGTQLARQGGQVSERLEWQGVDCSLGDTAVHLVDRLTNTQTGPFLVVGKFVNVRLPDARLEMIAVLGMNFLTDNQLRLVVDGAGGNLIARLAVPCTGVTPWPVPRGRPAACGCRPALPYPPPTRYPSDGTSPAGSARRLAGASRTTPEAVDLLSMKIRIPVVPIELEITARRRTEPFRFRVRTLLFAVAVMAIIIYLSLPYSPADRRLMAMYERLGNNEPKPGLTKDQVISQIGQPSSMSRPAPNTCIDHIWIAHFDRPMSHQEFELNLAIDPDTDLVAAWGSQKTEYQGLELIWFRMRRLLERIN